MLFDVAVLGGGPAGAATAIALRQYGLSVAVVERRAAPRERPGETLAPAARVVLEALGLWERFLADGHVPVSGNRSVWGAPAPGESHFIASAYGVGWHLDRRRFETCLRTAAQERGALLLLGTPLGEAAFDGWVWRLRAGGSLQARFCVDASGRAASLARSSGASRVSIDRLVALARFCERRTETAPADTFTLVEAVAEGWWYSAALPGDRLILAFMTDADLAAAARLTTPADFEARLSEAAHTHARARSYAPLGPPRVHSAGTSRLSSSVGPAWLAVGDAALSFDPLSSCGLETALRGGLRAADAIAAHLAGDRHALAVYAGSVTADYRRYLVERALHYGLERRFGDAPFWQRRQAHLPSGEHVRALAG